MGPKLLTFLNESVALMGTVAVKGQCSFSTKGLKRCL
jgi:hypothetical protein